MKLPAGFRGLLWVALAAGLHAEEKPAGEPAKSANWLVDGVAGQTADDAKLGASTADGRSTENSSRAYAKPDNGTANPLSSYLTTWMTPRDVEILKLRSADATTPGGTTITAQDRSVSQGPAANLRKNPYLSDPAAEPPISAKNPPVTPVAPAPVSLAPPPPKDAATPAKTPGPPADLLKSQDDAKYFPQLKRF